MGKGTMYSLPENPSEYLDGAGKVALINDAELQYQQYYRKAAGKDRHRLRADIKKLDVAIESLSDARAFSVGFPTLILSISTLALSLLVILMNILNGIRTSIDAAKNLKELWGDAAWESIQSLAPQANIIQSIISGNQRLLLVSVVLTMPVLTVFVVIMFWLFTHNAKSRKKAYYSLYRNAAQQRLDELLAGEARGRVTARCRRRALVK